MGYDYELIIKDTDTWACNCLLGLLIYILLFSGHFRLRRKDIRDFMIANNLTQDSYDYLTLDGDKLQGYYLKQ